MNFIVDKVQLPNINSIIERARLPKNIDFNLLENKYKNINLNSIVNEKSLNEILNDFYKKVQKNTIFNLIKYKKIGGIKLEIKGRLTKRYRADRALFKVKWKGGLKNIDSSYKGLSSVNMRGYVKPNVQYSIFTSKRRIGAFAVKGWISGK